MKRSTVVLVTALGVMVVILACRRVSSPNEGRRRQSSSPSLNASDSVGASPAGMVPAVPPDSLPSDYSDTTKAVSGGEFVAGMILPDILVLGFRRNTSQADRQSAIALVKGMVVGGRKRPDGDGLYLIRVPVDGTLKPLFHAIERLKQLPQVSTVTPEVIFSDLHRTRSFDLRGVV